MYANMYPNMYASMYAYTPMVYNPAMYQVGGCKNNDGMAVPCAGVDTTLTLAPVQHKNEHAVPQAAPVAPVQQRIEHVAVAPQAGAAPAIAAHAAPATAGHTGVISVKKREADPVYYLNGLSTTYGFPQQPVIYSQAAPATQPVVYSQATPAIQPVVYSQPTPAIQPVVYSQPSPVVYSGPVGCRNNEGKVVACIGEPEPKAEAHEMMAEAKAPVPMAKSLAGTHEMMAGTHEMMAEAKAPAPMAKSLAEAPHQVFPQKIKLNQLVKLPTSILPKLKLSTLYLSAVLFQF
jgi:hypothetical protein